MYAYRNQNYVRSTIWFIWNYLFKIEAYIWALVKNESWKLNHKFFQYSNFLNQSYPNFEQ